MSLLAQIENEDMANAFAEVLKAENHLSNLKLEAEQIAQAYKIKISDAEVALTDAWKEVEKQMKKNGVTEDRIPCSDDLDYKVFYGKASEKVKVEMDALPKEFVKTEEKPMLKEISKHLKTLRNKGLPLPNWGSLEESEPELQWKAVKRKHHG